MRELMPKFFPCEYTKDGRVVTCIHPDNYNGICSVLTCPELIDIYKELDMTLNPLPEVPSLPLYESNVLDPPTFHVSSEDK